MKTESNTFFAPQAWVQGAWAQDVLLTVAADGHWSQVLPRATPAQQVGATRLNAPVLPGLVNAHSHAFQRAIAGLTERRSPGANASDDFWSWRDRMYSAALRIGPDQLEAIATQLYAELLAGGFTQVCEFHYLHHAPDGQPYANPAEMSLALVRAAQHTGMGLTLLPTLYMRSGFTATGLRDDQRRFATTPEGIARIVEEVQRHTRNDPRIQVGIALHSLRAVSPPALTEMVAYARQAGLPVHIHIAEQTQEVDDCLAHTGQRPIEWLLHHAQVDARWNLVHATHTTAAELAGVQRAGASIVICPATEANLGDGVFDLPGYAAVQGRWSLGTDSHVTRHAGEELRLLEYSQRLALRKRNVSAQVLGQASTAAALLQGALDGGSQAAGVALGGIAVGERADFVTLDTAAPALLGLPAEHVLDAYLFSSPAGAARCVFVAGRATPESPRAAQNFAEVMQTLWAA
jgi:formimidoylglutamate deiminase